MKRILALCTLCFLAATLLVAAAPVKLFVNEFSLPAGAASKQLATTLQTLLASRISGDQLLVVDKAAGADIVVSGSYTTFGRSFSLDATARNATGGVVARAFEQGEGEEQVIAAVGRLAEKLNKELSRGATTTSQVVHPSAAAVPVVVASPASDIIRSQPSKGTVRDGVSDRIVGELRGMAVGATNANGDRELYLIGNRTLALYRQGKGVQKVAEVTPGGELLAVDTADLDGDGVLEIYVTAVNGENLSSQVWQRQGDTLVRRAEKLPYYFRALSTAGAPNKIYLQSMGRGEDFYGDVKELLLQNASYQPGPSLKLPRFATLYNFNRLADGKGGVLTVVLHPDGYLLVYNDAGEELWRSSERYGGSEVYFKRDDLENIRTTGDQYRWVYLEQRLFTLTDGTLIIARNSSDQAPGKSRSYRKSDVVAMAWSGAALEELWRTKESQSYLADLAVDEGKKELLLLQVVKRGGPFKDGATVVSLKRWE